MGRRAALTGNQAVAEAVRLARVGVISAYPITPQTVIVERLAEMVERGVLDARFIRVESEHSALAAAYGAAVAGVRAFTATSSHGLLYMHEVVWWVAGSRVPLVMAVVTRAIGPPWNIHDDHCDILDQRDTGWLISMASSNQEALDLTLMAFRVSEDERVFLPVMVGLDGFILSHTVEAVDIPGQDIVDEFLPERRQPYVIEPGSPVSMGNIAPDEYYEELRIDMYKSMMGAVEAIRDAGRAYGRLTGRYYDSLIDCYKCCDADYVVVGMGAWMEDAKEAADALREEGLRVGVARLRFLRPHPWRELAELVPSNAVLVFMDRGVSMGSAGQLYLDASGWLEGFRGMVGVVAGVGGSWVTVEDFEEIVRRVAGMVEEVGGGLRIPLLWYHGGVFSVVERCGGGVGRGQAE